MGDPLLIFYTVLIDPTDELTSCTAIALLFGGDIFIIIKTACGCHMSVKEIEIHLVGVTCIISGIRIIFRNSPYPCCLVISAFGRTAGIAVINK